MSCAFALEEFIQNYIASYQTKLGEDPRYYFSDETSPCLLANQAFNQDDALQWQYIKRQQAGNFSNVETALDIVLHPDINQFYGQFYSPCLLFDAPFGQGELIQVYSEDDFAFLQQNIIGHLMMKKKLKQDTTWFVGVLDDSDQMLTVNNHNASVWLETAGKTPDVKIADNLAALFCQLKPRIAPAINHTQSYQPTLSEDGLVARLKTIWGNLKGKG